MAALKHQLIAYVAVVATAFSAEAHAIAPFCVYDSQFNHDEIYHRQDLNACARGEHYIRLPGDIYPPLSVLDRTINRNNAVLNLDPNDYYRDFTVSQGVVLRVPSGTVLRVFRHFINNGTIEVDTAAAGSRRNVSAAGDIPASAPAHPGLSFGAAADGQVSGAFTISGSRVLPGHPNIENLFSLRPGLVGGGGGGAGEFDGGRGGGTFVVLARGAIRNNGTITALGGAAFPGGGGGGGGGMIVLAAEERARNFGVINVTGGRGGESLIIDSVAAAPGGGGGAGIVYFVSPEIVTGTITANGGAGGTLVEANAGTASVFVGGGSGGSLIGVGGSGGGVSAGSLQQAQVGGLGATESVTSRPSSLASF